MEAWPTNVWIHNSLKIIKNLPPHITASTGRNTNRAFPAVPDNNTYTYISPRYTNTPLAVLFVYFLPGRGARDIYCVLLRAHIYTHTHTYTTYVPVLRTLWRVCVRDTKRKIPEAAADGTTVTGGRFTIYAYRERKLRYVVALL